MGPKAFWETLGGFGAGSNHFVCIPTFAVFPPAACLLLPAVQRGHYDQAVIAAPDQPLVCKAAPYYSPRLLVGNGNLALRYYNDVVKGKDVSAEYAGYAAQNPVVELPNYLGTVADLHKILESTRITHIVIAEETQNRSELLQITAIAENYGIKSV